MSRLNLATEAVRPSMKGRVLLAGPPGAGKTKTALSIATVLAEGQKFLGIDTERGTMLTYAVSPDNPTGFEFQHLAWSEPYDIVELTDTIKEAGQEYPVLVLDSITHFWKEPGGILDMVEGRFGGWKGVRPMQADLMRAILDSPAHVILCVRSKLAYAQEYDDRQKKQVVRKLGMEIEFDKSLESEVQVFVELDMTHTMSISKSRSDAVPVGKTYAAHHERDFATAYAEWLRAGDPFADLEEQARIDQARRALDPDQKRVLWDLWQRHALPNPENMTATHVAIADKLIAQVTAGPADRGAQKAAGAAERLRAAADAEATRKAAQQPAQPAENAPADTGQPEAEPFPESQGEPFGETPDSPDADSRPTVRMSAMRKGLLGECERRWGDGYAEAIKVAMEGVPLEKVTNDELRSLLFPDQQKAS